MSRNNPDIGEHSPHGDGGYEMFVGGSRGWILCDDHAEVIEELALLYEEES